MHTDPLTEIVRSLGLTGCVFLEAEFTAPWAITAHVTEEDCRPFMPLPNKIVAYHVVTEGEAIVSMDTGDGYRADFVARRGDVVFLPSNALHVLASEPGQPLCSGDDLLLPGSDNGLVQIRHGGGGAVTRILCGFIACSRAQCPLLDSLPELLVISIESAATRRWIEASIAIAAQERGACRLAAESVMSRVSELLLIEALRAHLEQNPHPTGWLAGMSDPRIARALSSIHANLDTPPSVATLAHDAGMSRSAFVDRFSELMGTGPRRYLLDQRITAARALLRDTDLPSAEIAYRVGYDAPEAFSRAFKRETGRSPADWRQCGQA
ncbi:MAG: AraC family transcriptional regulator [Pseudomonadota bacterium]